MLTDVRLAFRRLRAGPVFAAGVIGTLAVGLAAATSMYTVVDGVLLKPLPFSEPDRLVRVGADFTGRGLKDVGLSQPELEDLARRSGAFSGISGVWSISANLVGADRPERVEVLLASADYFTLLGARPALGRTFTQADETPGIAAPIVISDEFWRRGFGGSASVLGRTLRIDDDPYEVVGVMPPGFRHPAATVETDVDVWAASGWKSSPFPPPSNSARFIRFAIARMQPGVTLAEARTRVDNLGRQLAGEHPDDYPARLGWTPRVTPLAENLVAGVRPALLVLMGGITFLLVIAITNISNLLLTRATAREREVAVQRALGASSWRVARSLMVEGAVLTALGAGAALVLSPWIVALLLRAAPDRLPRVTDVGVDMRALLFAVGLTAVTAIFVSLAPALHSIRAGIVDKLKESGRGVPGSRRSRTLRRGFVVAQVAVAILLLAGAGLLVRSLHNLTRVRTGIDSQWVMTARTWLPQPNDPSTGPYFKHEARTALIRRILDRLQASPGIAHAGFSTTLPLVEDGNRPAAFAAEGWTPDKSDSARASLQPVTPGYFAVLGIKPLNGRLITDQDDERAPRVAVINETAARAYFSPDLRTQGSTDPATQGPIGHRFRFVGRRGQIAAEAPWVTIVGVVPDVREEGIDAAVAPMMYLSLWQNSSLALTVVAKGAQALPSADVIRQAIQEADPNVPIYATRSVDELMDRGLAQRSFAARLIAAFALLALALASFGLHSVIAYNVRLRTHEIGVRLALGATAGQMRRMILAEGMRLAIVGVVVGVAGAILLSRALATLLFEVKARDPITLAVVVGLLLAVVGAATFAAARRVGRIDLAIALRPE
jgi:predicted permease